MFAKHYWAKFAIVAFTLIAAGCSSIDPYTGERRTSRATYGSGMGAAGGAAVGALVAGKGDRTEGALIGAAAGALLGGGIGHHMDMKAEALHSQLAHSGISARRYGNTVELDNDRAIYFEKNSSVLHSEFRHMLNNLAEILMRPDFRNTNIMIDGYAASYEQGKSRLAQSRAERVADFLFERGVATHRMRVRGNPNEHDSRYGDSRGNRKATIRLSPMRG